MKRIRTLAGTLLAGLVMLTLSSCGEEMQTQELDGTMVKQNLEAIRGHRVYFGHQSVGKNMMLGLQEWVDGLKIEGFNLVNLDSAPAPEGAYFGHARLGSNEHPESKCEAFSGYLLQAPAYDAALLKFCYVDVTESTDLDKLMGHYKETMAKLKAAHPGTRFIHVTVPLLANSGGWKLPLKRLVGWADYNDASNIRRNEYNAGLAAAFPGEPLFDVAAIESTRPDGSRESWKKDGKTYYSLYGAYTHDGGHLNKGGRALVSARLAAFLAGELSGTPPIPPAVKPTVAAPSPAP